MAIALTHPNKHQRRNSIIVKPIVQDNIGFQKSLKLLDKLYVLNENWDCNGSLKPKEKAIDKANFFYLIYLPWRKKIFSPIWWELMNRVMLFWNGGAVIKR